MTQSVPGGGGDRYDSVSAGGATTMTQSVPGGGGRPL